MPSRHKHRWGQAHRGRRHCSFCGKIEWRINGEWKPDIGLSAFAYNWLPAISGTDPKKMMAIDVAFPFEWNCYESWNVVFRVRFDFTDVLGRTQAGLGTRVDIMNGWRSDWHECFARIDAQARDYYRERTGRDYEIGDNTYGAMREIIQH